MGVPRVRADCFHKRLVIVCFSRLLGTLVHDVWPREFAGWTNYAKRPMGTPGSPFVPAQTGGARRSVKLFLSKACLTFSFFLFSRVWACNGNKRFFRKPGDNTEPPFTRKRSKNRTGLLAVASRLNYQPFVRAFRGTVGMISQFFGGFLQLNYSTNTAIVTLFLNCTHAERGKICFLEIKMCFFWKKNTRHFDTCTM